jgi:fructose-bisphosphate aldolase class I
MNLTILRETATALFANGKGILAMDDDIPRCNENLAAAGVPQTEESRRRWRELIITTPRLNECISGVILYDETIRQQRFDGMSFVRVLENTGILIGIKVDTGSHEMPWHSVETLTDGLYGLQERLAEYAEMGARFAKWRAQFHLGTGLPSRACIDANCKALAYFASYCQQVDLVPIVETEILMEGDHSLAQSYGATEKVLHNLFQQLARQKVALEGVIVKPNMVLSGLICPSQAGLHEVCDATLRCLRQNVPTAIAGVVFLSGGQSPSLASARLNYMEAQQQKSPLPWPVGFSFSDATQQAALALWQGQDANTLAAQHALFHRANCDRAARRGNYTPAMERLCVNSAALNK